MLKNLRTVGASIVGTLAFSPAAVTLTVLSVCFFVIQRVASGIDFVDGYSYGALLTQCFGLHAPLLTRGFVWQVVTYLFLHGSWLHVTLNLLTVLLFGAGLEMEIGGRRFWTVFLVGGAIGGLGWVACDAVQPALAAYNARRTLRTARVQLMSRAVGEHVYHPAGPHAALRNTIMRAKSQAEWRETLAWLYGQALQSRFTPPGVPPSDASLYGGA